MLECLDVAKQKRSIEKAGKEIYQLFCNILGRNRKIEVFFT